MAWTGRAPGGVRKGWEDTKAAKATHMTDGTMHHLVTTIGIDLGKMVCSQKTNSA
jgi:hypothetical protein